MAHEEDFNEDEDEIVPTDKDLLGQERTWIHPSELPPNYSVKNIGPKIKKVSTSALIILAILTALLLGGQKSTPNEHTTLPPNGIYSVNKLKNNTALSSSIANTKKTLVSIRSQGPLGTKYGYGVIVRTDGIVLTTYNIIKGSQNITVTTSRGITTSATLLGTSSSQNIGLIKVNIANLQATDFSSSDSIKNNQKALLDLPSDKAIVGNTSTTRSNNQLTQQFIGPTKSLAKHLQGGLLLDAKGHLLAILGTKNNSTSHILISVKAIRKAVNKIFQKANIQRGWLGVKIQDVDKGSHLTGVMIKEVDPTSPAAQAGLVPLETITSINGYKISSIHGLIYSLNFHLPGQSVIVGIKNKNKAQSLKIKLVKKASV